MRGDGRMEKTVIEAEKQKIAFDNAVAFLAEIYRKYGDLIQPATLEDVLEYLREQKAKSA